MVEELTEDKEIAYAVMLVSETAFVGAPVCTTLSFSPVGLGCPSIDSKKAPAALIWVWFHPVAGAEGQRVSWGQYCSTLAQYNKFI